MNKMDNDIETIEYKSHIIHIRPDNDAENPRDTDNFGTMICFHKRYNLGDKHSMSIEGFKEWLKENEKKLIILPLYLYDHSGITMRTNPFNDYWDSGQVGYIYIEKDKAKKEFKSEKLMKEHIDKIKENLIQEVDVYDKYIAGNICGFVIEEPNFEDSCWGFYDIKEAIRDAKGSIDENIKELELMEFRTVGQLITV
jgi:hypothetical protein